MHVLVFINYWIEKCTVKHWNTIWIFKLFMPVLSWRMYTIKPTNKFLLKVYFLHIIFSKLRHVSIFLDQHQGLLIINKAYIKHRWFVKYIKICSVIPCNEQDRSKHFEVLVKLCLKIHNFIINVFVVFIVWTLLLF